jgi:hypothetical protein
LAVHKSSGSSGEGVAPVSGGVAIPYLDPANVPAAASSREGAPERTTADFVAYRNHAGCDGGGRRVVPQAGMSDVEPALVCGISRPLTVRTQTQLI